MEDTTIATIDKNQTSDIRIRLVEFHGKSNLDIRTFVVADAVDRIPTRKGIAIPPKLLRRVIEALNEAAAQLSDEPVAEDAT